MAKPASGATINVSDAQGLATSLKAVWGFLEGSGTTCADSTGNGFGLTGIGSNGTSWTTISGEAAVALTGANIPLPITTGFTLGAAAANFSFAFRAKQTSSNIQGGILGDSTDGTANGPFFFGGNYLRFEGSQHTAYNFTGVTSFTADADWVLSIDNTNLRAHLYKDGVEVSGSPLTLSPADSCVLKMVGNVRSGDSAIALIGTLTYLYVWAARVLSATDAANLHTNPYEFFATPGITVRDNATTTITALPSNHGAGTVTVKLLATGGAAFGNTDTFTVAGVAGWSINTKTWVDSTHVTLILNCPAAASPPAGTTGTLTITDSTTTVSTTIPVTTPTLSSAPAAASVGTTPTLTLAGVATLWGNETAAGLFTVTGGTGSSLATPTVTTNTAATDVLTYGSVGATETITDTSTGAQCTINLIPAKLVTTDWIDSWFTRGLAYDGTNTYLGGVNSGGTVLVGKYVQSSAAFTTHNLTTGGAVDDHNNPGLLVLSAAGSNPGKILAIDAPHNSPSHSYRSTSAADISAFGSAVNVEVGGGAAAYAEMVQLADASKTVFDFYRYDAGGLATAAQPWYRTTTDGGTTWSAATQYFSNPGQRPYRQVCPHPNGTRFDIFPNDGGPDDLTTGPTLYHLYGDFSSGSLVWKDSTGATITLPATTSTATTVFDGHTSHEGSWPYDCAWLGGTLYVFFVKYGTAAGSEENTHHYYMLGHWTGSAWSIEQVCNGGSYVPNGLVGGGGYYSGGMAIDPNTLVNGKPRVYVGRMAAVNNCQVEQWEWSGSAWAFVQTISGDTGTVNARPKCTPGLSPTEVWYWSGEAGQANGGYTSSAVYLTDLYRFQQPTGGLNLRRRRALCL